MSQTGLQNWCEATLWIIDAIRSIDGGMWESHHLLWRMLWFLLPWFSVPMRWSWRVGGKVLGRWIHFQQIEGWRNYGIKSPQSSVQFFKSEFSLDHLEKVFRWNFLTVAWRGFDPNWKARTEKKSTLASNQVLNVQNLVVISLFYNFHSLQ